MTSTSDTHLQLLYIFYEFPLELYTALNLLVSCSPVSVYRQLIIIYCDTCKSEQFSEASSFPHKNEPSFDKHNNKQKNCKGNT